MTAPTAEAEPRTTDTGSGGEIAHAVCLKCDPHTAFCGLDVTDEPLIESSRPEDRCVMCVEVVRSLHSRCPKCGSRG